MPIPDDDRFEQYLKQFRPLVPGPLPATIQSRRQRRWLTFGAWAIAAALLVMAAFLVMHPRHKPGSSPGAETLAQIERAPESQPLTLGRAHELLTSAPSLKSAVDHVATQALQSRGIPLPENRQSALMVLGKEKTKL